MEAARTLGGIYGVLWYKSKDYQKPDKFKDANELKMYLEDIAEGTSIKIIIIDASRKLSPSKLKNQKYRTSESHFIK